MVIQWGHHWWPTSGPLVAKYRLSLVWWSIVTCTLHEPVGSIKNQWSVKWQNHQTWITENHGPWASFICQPNYQFKYHTHCIGNCDILNDMVTIMMKPQPTADSWRSNYFLDDFTTGVAQLHQFSSIVIIPIQEVSNGSPLASTARQMLAHIVDVFGSSVPTIQ